MELFSEVIKKNTEVSAWKLRTIKKQAHELYYVGQKLETSRKTDTVSHVATVYVDKEGKRGSASFTVYDYMSEEEMAAAIDKGVYAAGFALNPWYDLPKPQTAENKAQAEPQTAEITARTEPEYELLETGLSLEEPHKVLESLVEAVFAADIYPEGSLNATEFFLYKTDEQITNSNGISVAEESYQGSIELIPSWEKDNKEVEVYHMLQFETPDPAKITKEVKEQLKYAAARFDAEDWQTIRKQREDRKADSKLPVLIQDEEAGNVFDYFTGDLTYASKVHKINRHELGESVQGENRTGTALNLKKVPYYEDAIRSRLFDTDGVKLEEIELIRDGIAMHRHGDYTFGQYLNVEHPTGRIPVTVVEEGTKSFAEMAQKPYLRCVKFSDFQLEPSSGYFGGEVRLGFYFDGTREIPVTGFTISGNVKVSAGSMIYSRETVTTPSYHGPKYLEIPDMEIV